MDKKFYVVWSGKIPGIYTCWDDCRKQVAGVQGARYKSFPTLAAAEEALSDEPSASYVPSESFQQRMHRLSLLNPPPVWQSISVDAACQGNPGKMEYRGVETATARELFHKGPFPEGTNNIGEFLALVHALAALKKKGSSLPVYTDSLTARKWVKDKQVKTKLQPTPANEEVFQLIQRALDWLRSNQVTNPVLTWDTQRWGEIPADFGRK